MTVKIISEDADGYEVIMLAGQFCNKEKLMRVFIPREPKSFRDIANEKKQLRQGTRMANLHELISLVASACDIDETIRKYAWMKEGINKSDLKDSQATKDAYLRLRRAEEEACTPALALAIKLCDQFTQGVFVSGTGAFIFPPYRQVYIINNCDTRRYLKCVPDGEEKLLEKSVQEGLAQKIALNESWSSETTRLEGELFDVMKYLSCAGTNALDVDKLVKYISADKIEFHGAINFTQNKPMFTLCQLTGALYEGPPGETTLLAGPDFCSGLKWSGNILEVFD